MSLYQTPNLYDLYYNETNEKPLKAHYEAVLKDKNIHSVHDCSIGTGNLSFVLADLEYQLSGSDISAEMLNRCEEKAVNRSLNLELTEADFITLDLHQTYDLVMSTGNSLPHVNEEALVDALISMKKHINEEGYLYIDLRNWDKIVEEEKRFQVYPPVIKDDIRTNVTLVRDFNEDHIQFNFLYTFEEEQKVKKTEVREVTYYPIMKNRLLDILKGLGFVEIELFNFINHNITNYNDMGWYCIICKKGL